jgi:hypothetical protein
MRSVLQILNVLTLATFLTPTLAQGTGSYYIDRDSCNAEQVQFVRTAMNGAFAVSALSADHLIHLSRIQSIKKCFLLTLGY